MLAVNFPLASGRKARCFERKQADTFLQVGPPMRNSWKKKTGPQHCADSIAENRQLRRNTERTYCCLNCKDFSTSFAKIRTEMQLTRPCNSPQNP